MIKIIVVDSDKNSITKIKKVISNISINYDVDVIVEYYSGYNEQLEKEIKNEEYKKIYIMEIDILGELSGIKLAEKIRENDWLSEIIFVTNHDKMFETVYRSVPRIFDFIEKFHNMDNRLKLNIEKILKQNFDYKMFIYKIGSVNIRLYFKSILYIYRDTASRKLVIVTANNTYEITAGISEIINSLDNRFKIVHRACIVNLDAINQFNWNSNSFVLTNGLEVNLLSKRYKIELEELFNEKKV